MKHAQSQAEMLNRGKDKPTSERVVAHVPDTPDIASLLQAYLRKPDAPVSPPSFRANTMKTQLRLLAWPFDVMKPEALAELDRLAGEGASIFEMVDVMDIDLADLRDFRWESEWFDELISALEGRAAYVRSVMGNDL
jgi:hypothetical protein